MTRRRVVISIDFELRWGVCDKLPLRRDAYERNLLGVPDAVQAMLSLFSEQRMGATWAVVGALACEGWDEYFTRAPTPPGYVDPRLRFDPAYREIDPQGRLHFAPHLVRDIAATPLQEIGSHSFGHIYLREPGCTADDVGHDARAAADVLTRIAAMPITSFVFPRNQVGYTDVLRANGIVRWRDNPRPFYWRASKDSEQSFVVRALRFADSITPLGRRGRSRHEMRASHFVRFGLPDRVWRAHLKRIAGDARDLRPDEALHLWWHPHNLGADVARSTRRLRELVDRIRDGAPDVSFGSMRDSAGTEPMVTEPLRRERRASR